jgi:hypothetical protein
MAARNESALLRALMAQAEQRTAPPEPLPSLGALYAPSGTPDQAPPDSVAAAPFDDQRVLTQIMRDYQPPSGPGQMYAPSGPPSAAPSYAVAAAPFDDQRELAQIMRESQRIAARRQELVRAGMSPQQALVQMAGEGLVDPRLAQLATRSSGSGGM